MALPTDATQESLFSEWMQAHQAQTYVFITKDHATGIATALEAVAADKLPAVLSNALTSAETMTWQRVSSDCIQRVGYEPALPKSVLQINSLASLRDLYRMARDLRQQLQSVDNQIEQKMNFLLDDLPT
jgi:alkaline phosphatase